MHSFCAALWKWLAMLHPREKYAAVMHSTEPMLSAVNFAKLAPICLPSVQAKAAPTWAWCDGKGLNTVMPTLTTSAY